MSESTFEFALELSDEGWFDGMLSDIAAAVFAHVGLHGADRDQLVSELREARRRTSGTGGRRCDVRFVVRSGHIDVVVDPADGREWRASRPLP